MKAYVIISGPNIACGKDALQGPGSLQNQGPQLAVDGNLNTTNDGVTCAHTSKGSIEQPAWWQVDLGDAYRITGIVIYNRIKDCMYIILLQMF